MFLCKDRVFLSEMYKLRDFENFEPFDYPKMRRELEEQLTAEVTAEQSEGTKHDIKGS